MKLKIYLIVSLIFISAVAFSLCTQEQEPSFEVPTPIETVPKETPTPVETKEEIKVEPLESDCNNCHYNENRQYVPQADKIENHLDASDFCIYCHVEDASSVSRDVYINRVHELHKNVYSDCSICHKTYQTGEIRCGTCHAPGDLLKPSNGNVFVIHNTANVGCKECHGEFIPIHSYGETFPDTFSFP